MQISDAGLKFIMREEGTVLHLYKDQVGIFTIGCGHVALPGEDFSGGITLQECMDLLRRDIGKCERELNDTSIIKVLLTQNEFDSMCSWLFNVGVHALEKSSTLTKLNAGDVKGAADGLLLWAKAGGVKNQGLYNRRVRERAVFMTPDPVPVKEPTEDTSTPQLDPIQEPTSEPSSAPDQPTVIPVNPSPKASLFASFFNFLSSLFRGGK